MNLALQEITGINDFLGYVVQHPVQWEPGLKSGLWGANGKSKTVYLLVSYIYMKETNKERNTKLIPVPLKSDGANVA